MADITITVWRTRVISGVVQGPSEQVSITIPDRDRDGLIDPKEWTSAIGGPPGHNGGDDSPGMLWKGDSTGSFRSGYLYSNVEYDGGERIESLIDQLKHNFKPVSPDKVNVCFLAGTRIATPAGEVAVEDLRPGDLVLTLDGGPQPVLWVSSDHVDADRLDRCPDLRPVKFARGALGPDQPRRPVLVSPQHRVMIRDHRGTEVLATARHLAEARMARVRVIRKPGPFTLCHVALASHHVLLADGAPMESFFPGPTAMRGLDPEARQSLLASLPSDALPMAPARRFLTRREVMALLKPAEAARQPQPSLS